MSDQQESSSHGQKHHHHHHRHHHRHRHGAVDDQSPQNLDAGEQRSHRRHRHRHRHRHHQQEQIDGINKSSDSLQTTVAFTQTSKSYYSSGSSFPSSQKVSTKDPAQVFTSQLLF